MTTPERAYAPVPNEELAFLGTGPVPAAPYHDPAYHELERDAVFRRTWLHVGRESEIGEADGYVVRRIGVARATILISRQADGSLRAFHNVCPHRGNELVWEDSGSAATFSCRYHQWSFSNDGALKAIPDQERFYDLDTASCGLRPVAVDTVAGFVFVHLDPSPATSLRDYLGPIAGELEEQGFGRFTDFEQYHVDVDANWKLAANNFQETYHVRWVHRPSSGGRATNAQNPFGYAASHRFSGPHSGGTHWIPPNPKLKDVQLQAMVAGRPAADAPCAGSWEFYYLFPNLYVEPLGGNNTFTMQFWPMGYDRTRLVVRIYRAGADGSAAQRFGREYSASSLLDVHTEDVDIIEGNFRGLRSGALDVIHLQAQEAMLRHFQQNVHDLVTAHTQARRPSGVGR